jgi:16S rRNA (cytosine967-C5)-methyltransferase
MPVEPTAVPERTTLAIAAFLARGLCSPVGEVLQDKERSLPMPIESTTARRLNAVPWHALGTCLPAVIAAVERVLQNEPGERVLDHALRGLGRDERAVMVEAVFGVGLWRRRLAYHAGSSSARHLLFCLLRDLARLPEPRAAELVALPPPFPPPRHLPRDLGTRFSLPDWLAGALLERFGSDGAEAFAAAINVPGPIALRANLLKTTIGDLAARLGREGVATRPGAHAQTCLVVDAPRVNLLPLASYREGLFEAQDEGSQLVVRLVEARPGESILDLCAGAGGKTLALAAEMQDSGTLHAFDIDEARLLQLERRAKGAGVSNLVLHRGALPGSLQVDRVLVDAPCSELGVLRRGPDLRWRIDPASFPALERTQRDLLRQAARHVRPGGRLVYATCTIRPQENEEAVRDLIATCPGLSAGRYFEVMPHLHGTDGFFAAVLALA